MNKLILRFLPLIMVLCMLSFAGCKPETQTTPEESTQQAPAKTKAPNPEKAIKEIYAGMGERIGLAEPSKSVMQEEMGIDLKDVDKTYIRYVDGDFGASDVYIIKPAEGEDENGKTHKENVINALKERKDDRIREFANYDIYDSTQISENAIIFERGGYVVMLMMEDNNSAREIIEKNIPEKLELS